METEEGRNVALYLRDQAELTSTESFPGKPNNREEIPPRMRNYMLIKPGLSTLVTKMRRLSGLVYEYVT